MGVILVGKNKPEPTTDALRASTPLQLERNGMDEYESDEFRRCWSAWTPLWHYSHCAAPGIFTREKFEQGCFNRVPGLDANEALQLSEAIKESIQVGHLDQWIDDERHYVEKTDPEGYVLTRDDVDAFVEYLETCGGFFIL